MVFVRIIVYFMNINLQNVECFMHYKIYIKVYAIFIVISVFEDSHYKWYLNCDQSVSFLSILGCQIYVPTAYIFIYNTYPLPFMWILKICTRYIQKFTFRTF